MQLIVFFLILSTFLGASESYRTLILWRGLGEYEWATRLQNTCQKMGWEAELSFFSMRELNVFDKLVVDKVVTVEEVLAHVERFHPDFILSLCHHGTFQKDIPHYLAISAGSLLDPFYQSSKGVENYRGFLVASPLINCLKGEVEARGRAFQSIKWYPSCPKSEYKEVKPERLFFCGFQWDSKRNGKGYQKLFSLLDEQPYFDCYGPKEFWSCAPKSNRGLLPFDGESVVQAIQKAGVALIIHADQHMTLHAPTSRIFEAAAACSVIISERHPFIVQEFGDAVLYIDDNRDPEILFSQIDSHMKWILNHPEEALALAKKAHSLFVEKFTLEKLLLDLAHFHVECQSYGFSSS